MELDAREKSHIWWKGTLKGAAKGLLVGLAVGAVSALLLQFAIFPALIAIAPTFGTGLAGVFSGFMSLHGAFSIAPLSVFSGISGLAGNLFSSGNLAVAQHQQMLDHQHNDNRVAALERRELALERAVTPSRSVRDILARGGRAQGSFQSAEDSRSADAPDRLPTIH